MSETMNSIRITSVAATILNALGVDACEGMDQASPIVLKAMEKRFSGKKADRVFMYNPDAVALWLYQKYTSLFLPACVSSDVALPMLSVMPSVTPVCFASIYTGLIPEAHGIRKYEKPVLSVPTVFDVLAKAGKKCAIVSTAGDSISCIFLNRDMDYFIYPTVDEVNEKARELIDGDAYDLIVVYNGNYDSTMHKNGPEAQVSLDVLKTNCEVYQDYVRQIETAWKKHNVLYAFAPDHGCHEIDGECGSHGLDMQEDMNIIHFYGFKKAE